MATKTTKTAAKKTTAKKTTASNGAQMTDFTDMMSFANGANWAETAKEQFETMMTSFGGNFEDMRAQAEEMTEEVQARFKATQDRAQETNAMLMEAAQEEVADAVQLASDLTNAKTFADALTVQQSYWTKLFETRMERAREMTEATVEVTRENMASVETPFASFKGFEKFFAFPVKA
ncbi:phasin family protein [Hyphococcus flavus]|uniref:Phasin family protein n=1 Tax=Hyphococcus flavus TaxID=1866326 RepID=A0AAE9ZA17_9PROT|nr:phasin family protein [Hyphococcus flavus]WDI30293.1 phasin family protein [Hyphococcus flavus]